MDGMMPASSTTNGSSEMYTYFYWGYKVHFLFSGWANHTPGGYVLTLAAIFILALFHEWFGELKKRLIHLSLHPPLSSTPSLPHAINDNKPLQPTFATSLTNFVTALLRKRATRIILLTTSHILVVASGYLLMLSVMSYNVGVFVCVLGGLALGFILFETPHM